jgi:hypothetical protein
MWLVYQVVVVVLVLVLVLVLVAVVLVVLLVVVLVLVVAMAVHGMMRMMISRGNALVISKPLNNQESEDPAAG